MSIRLVLASQSPARLATLRSAGVEPEVVVSGFDESTVTETDPVRLASALAAYKARVVADRVGTDAVVIGCDSVLDLDGEVHGKPRDADDARARLRRMRGGSGVLHTGHCVIHNDREVVRDAATTVYFGDFDDALIDAYVATGEPLNVAGSFTIDGLGGPFIEGVEGDPHNVVGISLPTLRHMLAEFGIEWRQLWHAS
ncbi:Maf family protein [Solicola gregarius]|uniref:Nucleoside triphosphate pyrophosphatase n=1 Tax=Solicola gregarius TaxID=2908642 RepID=A0AA46TES4_9ACTN|nr:Maf family protein [Solicola gregarius]UYM04006.1 Maf-like protein [Solicola gregarius]